MEPWCNNIKNGESRSNTGIGLKANKLTLEVRIGKQVIKQSLSRNGQK